MIESFESAIVRVYASDGTFVGAGFLVTDRHVLTCAHVVASALGLSEDTPALPQAGLHLDFPLLAPDQVITAHVVHWQPATDVAGLELTSEPPPGASAIRLVTAGDLWGHPFRALGFLAGYEQGVWASGVLRGRQADGWLQIEDPKMTGYLIAPGFSGGPVWDDTLEGVVGMIVAADTSERVKTAFLIPADVLAQAWPDCVESVQEQLEQAPFQAIADLPHFVGREQELRALEEALLAGQQVTLCSLEGMGGVGKTALAAHIVYQLRPHFYDGVLWARLDTSDTMSILSAFADAYGRDVSKFTDVDSRGQVVRGVLANKRALIVLDNARHSEEVSPLLPPTGTCAVIVTTRRRDLSVTRGAQKFDIGPFNKEKQESFDLFIRILGEERARQESAILNDISDFLGHLPLAVDIVASRLAYESGWSASDLMERIRQEGKRLDELKYEDLNVRASFNVSYDMLTPGEQRFFASLGVFGGEDFSVEAAACVAGVLEEEAHDSLRKLYGLSLVLQGRSGRYRLHPLLRDYAREKITSADVFERMVVFFVHYVENHERDYGILDLETSDISEALETAHNRGMQAALVQGTNVFCHFLGVRGLYRLARTHLNRSEQAARAIGDNIGLITTLVNLGRTMEIEGNSDQAEAYYQEGLALARELGQREEIATLLLGMGGLAGRRGDYTQAEKYLLEGLAVARQVDNRKIASAMLQSLGANAANRGDYEHAEKCWLEGLALARDTSDLERISGLLSNLGGIENNRGNYMQAEEYLLEGLTVARQIGHRERIGMLLQNLGANAGGRRDYSRAEEYLLEGLLVARQIGHQELTSRFLDNLGWLANERGDYRLAEEYLLEGLRLARQAGHSEMICRLLDSLGSVARELGAYTLAEERWLESLAIARQIKHPEVICRLLDNLGWLADRHGDYERAEQHWSEALALARQVEFLWLSSNILSELGKIRLKQQELDSARSDFLQALEIARKIDDQFLIATASYGLALVEYAHGNITEARQCGQESLAIFEIIGHKDAIDVREWLDELSTMESSE